jgi:hypothetical protein
VRGFHMALFLTRYYAEEDDEAKATATRQRSRKKVDGAPEVKKGEQVRRCKCSA